MQLEVTEDDVVVGKGRIKGEKSLWVREAEEHQGCQDTLSRSQRCLSSPGGGGRTTLSRVRAKASDLYVTVTLHCSTTSQWGIFFFFFKKTVAIIINAY